MYIIYTVSNVTLVSHIWYPLLLTKVILQ